MPKFSKIAYLKVSFLGIQNGKAQPFFKIATWNLAHIFIGKGSYTNIPIFENNKIFLKKKENKFSWLLSPIFKIFKNLKIWDSSLIATFNLHVLLQPIGSILKNVL